MSQQQFARRPQTMFNDYRYPMPKSDAPVEGAKYPARWTWELSATGSSVFFKVNDGVFGKDDRNAKNKEVELSAFDRGALFNLMEEACNNPNFTKSQYVVRKVTFGNQGRLNDHPSVLGTFTIMRDKEGVISVGYTKGTYKVRFQFISPFDSIILVSTDGGEPREDRGLMSRMFVKAFIKFSRKFLDEAEFANYKPKEKKDGGNGGGQRQGGGNSWGGGNGGGGNGGGNSWGGGNNGGGQRQSAPAPSMDFDDNIDF